MIRILQPIQTAPSICWMEKWTSEVKNGKEHNKMKPIKVIQDCLAGID